MQIYTLNVGQGQFVVVTGTNEAFIVDTFVPLSTAQETVFVKSALSRILANKKLVGLLVTGFDADHFCEPGMKLVLNKYRPDWIMYPKYFKETDTANRCFASIRALEGQKEIAKHSIVLSENVRRLFNSLSREFTFEVFSPHRADMNSSNNCSIVCKMIEKATGATYLITGDTEDDRWSTIANEFRTSLKADVLAAAHHGSDNGITAEALKYVEPHTILVSAGVGSQYGHPGLAAQRLFGAHSEKWYSTNSGKGQSLRTIADGKTVSTYLFVV